MLIYQSYMSLTDLEFCARFDIAEFAGHPHLSGIAALHAEVRSWAETDDYEEVAGSRPTALPTLIAAGSVRRLSARAIPPSQ